MKRLILLAALAFCSTPAKAIVYDWDFSAHYICGGGPGCAIISGGTTSGFGSLVSEIPIGSNGVLHSTDAINILSWTTSGPDLLDILRTGTVLVPVTVRMGGCNYYNQYNCDGSSDTSVTFEIPYPTEVHIQPAIPELSTWAMMILGFAGLAGLSVSRHRKHNQLG